MTQDESKKDTGQHEEEETKEDTELFEEDEEHNRAEELKDGELLELYPEELVPNELNEEIYGSDELEEDFVESIRLNGQITAIVITQKKEIVSGHRRWRAILIINEERLLKDEAPIKAICIVKSFSGELERMEAIIEANRSREKSPDVVFREAKKLQEIYAKRAEERRFKNLPNLKPPKYIEELNSVHRAKTEDLLGRTMDIIAEKVNEGRDTLAKLMIIGNRVDAGDSEAIDIMNEIKSKDLSVHAGFTKLKMTDISKNPDDPKAEEARKHLKRIKNGSMTPNRAWVLLGKPKKRSKEKLEQITDKTEVLELSEEIFNVIVADPQDKYKAMKMQITEATDGALFLWATTKNMSDRVDLMAQWGFELKTIAVWDKGISGGTWFDGAVEFLLFGIKGNWETPIEKFPIIFRKGDEPDKSNYDLIYDMVEKMFPGQNYLDPFRETGREGWGKPIYVE
jgi:ParB-like chromosome segregation protein Spo0J